MGFNFGTIKHESVAKITSRQIANMGDGRIQMMYELIPFLDKWYTENEKGNNIFVDDPFARFNDQHNATYIKNTVFDKEKRTIKLKIAKPILGGNVYNEKEYYLLIRENDNRTIDIVTDCICIDIGLLYFLSNIDRDIITINAIYFDITDKTDSNIVNIIINDTRNMYLSFPIQEIPDCKYEKFWVPEIKFVNEIKDIKVNVFINYSQFNILLKEHAIIFTKIFDNIVCQYPIKIAYQSLFDINDPVFEYNLTKDLVYQPVKLNYIIYSSEQFINKYP